MRSACAYNLIVVYDNNDIKDNGNVLITCCYAVAKWNVGHIALTTVQYRLQQARFANNYELYTVRHVRAYIGLSSITPSSQFKKKNLCTM